MNTESLQEQVSRIHPGDEVEVVFRLNGIERPSVSGEAWADEGVLYIGNSTLRYHDGRPASILFRIVSHTPKRRQITRDDIIEKLEDSSRWIIPNHTAFRLASGAVAGTYIGAEVKVWPPSFFPVRCVDVLSDWKDES